MIYGWIRCIEWEEQVQHCDKPYIHGNNKVLEENLRDLDELSKPISFSS